MTESETGTAALWTDGDPAECQVLKLWAQTVHRPQSVRVTVFNLITFTYTHTGNDKYFFISLKLKCISYI